MRLPAAAALLAITVALAGCGGSRGPSRAHRAAAVTRYIDRVDTTERAMRAQLVRITNGYRSFSTHPAQLRKSVPRFARAETTFRTLDRRLRRIATPADARRLRRLLLGLVDAETRLSHELTRLAAFLPAFQADLTPLKTASSRLKASLARITVPKPRRVPRSKLAAAKKQYAAAVAAAIRRRADAIEAYLASVARVQKRVAALKPPAVMEPSDRAQLLTMQRVRTAGARLVSALLAHRYKSVPALDRSFQAAALTSGSLAVQRASIAAVKAYDARVHATVALARRVEAERTRLQKALS